MKSKTTVFLLILAQVLAFGSFAHAGQGWSSCSVVKRYSSNADLTTEELSRLWAGGGAVDIFVMESFVFSCPCVGGARLGARDDGARIGARDDGARIGARDDDARIGAKDDGARVGARDDNARIGAKEDGPRLGARDDDARVGARDDNARIGAKDDGARVGAKGDGARLGGAEDGSRLVGNARGLVCAKADNQLGYIMLNPFRSEVRMFDGQRFWKLGRDGTFSERSK